MYYKKPIIYFTCLLFFVLSGCSGKQQSISRARLISFMDQYLEALESNHPSILPLSDNVIYTENGQDLKLGDGIWGTSNLVRESYKQYFIDTIAGQSGIFCVIEENGHPEIVAIRLKITNEKITEIEKLVARSSSDPWYKPDAVVKQPIFDEVLKPEERRNRQEMIAITNSYFEGLEFNTDSLTPFAPSCIRIENGNITANNPDGENPIQRMSAGEQFATGFSSFITRIHERRYPIVDEERGLVYAIIFFDHAGHTEATMKNGITFKVPPPYDTPFCWMIGELFKIKDGKIFQIEAVMLDVPYGMPSGWVK